MCVWKITFTWPAASNKVPRGHKEHRDYGVCVPGYYRVTQVGSSVKLCFATSLDSFFSVLSSAVWFECSKHSTFGTQTTTLNFWVGTWKASAWIINKLFVTFFFCLE